MMNRRQIRFFTITLLVVALAIAGVVLASSDSDFAVGMFRIGPGGVFYCKEGFSVISAIGQPMAGESSGGSYSLVSGIRMEEADCTSISMPVIVK